MADEQTMTDLKDLAGAVEGEQALGDDADVLGPGVEAQHRGLAEVALERAVLDGLGRHRRQRQRVELALLGVARVDRRGVEHGEQLAGRVEDRRGRTAQADVAREEVLVAVHGHRLALHDAGADAVRAFVALAPVGAEPEAGALEHAGQSGRGHAVEDHTVGVGQDDRAAGTGDLLVQPVHLDARQFDEVLQFLLALRKGRPVEHQRAARQDRFEAMVGDAALPRARDRRVGGRAASPGIAVPGNRQHASGVLRRKAVQHALLLRRAGGHGLVVVGVSPGTALRHAR